MPKFRYSVANKENKQLTGTISAPDERSAREELNQLGFSIVSIAVSNETDENSTPEKTIPKFEFAAIDRNMKRIVGTIQSEDRFNAYKRLVKEYLFEVEYLFDTNSSEEEKTSLRRKGVYELQNRLDEEDFQAKAKEQGQEFDIAEFTQKQETLRVQVDFVLKKVKELLDGYETEMKPETKEKIRKYIDKILRLKSSTNLDYLRKSCEDLLTFIQKEEIFLHEEVRQREHAKLSLEAKNMMSQLHHRQDSANVDLGEKALEWREKHIENNPQPSFIEKIINFFISFFIGFSGETEEEKAILQNIRIINQQLKQYLFLYFQAQNQDYKLEAKDGLSRLWQERKKLKRQLSVVKQTQKKQSNNSTASTIFDTLSDEAESFSGWLLAFYLVYYFISFYATTKDFGSFHFPATIEIYRTAFLKYFLVSLFLFHASISIKNNFFRKNEGASLLLIPTFILSTLIVFLNF